MKIYKILLVCILVCTTMQANTLNLEVIESEKSERADKDELINRMIEDEDVVSLLGKVYAINFVKGLIIDQDVETQKEFEAKLEVIGSTFKEESQKINTKFPEYKSLSKTERKEVVSTIYQKSISLRESLKCFGNKTMIAIGACGGSRLVGWGLAKFSFCITTAVAIDAGEEVISEGTATEVVLQEAVPEINFCGRVSNALTVPVTYTCLAGYAGSIFDCFGVF